MPIARSSLAGATTGVVLLAGALGLGVGLPKLTDEQFTGGSAELPQLPDQFDDRFKAISSITPEDGKASTEDEIKQMQAFASEALKEEATANDRLADLYGDAVVRSYLDVPGSLEASQSGVRPAQFAITVIEGDGGLVIPSGPFPIEENGTHYELKKIDGHQCSLIWVDPVDPSTGQPTGEKATAANYQVECRAESNGLAYDIYSTGLTPDEAVHYLNEALENAES